MLYNGLALTSAQTLTLTLTVYIAYNY